MVYLRNLVKHAALIVFGLSAMVGCAQDSKASLNFPDFSAIQLIGRESRPVPMKVYWSGAAFRIDTTPVLADLFLPAADKVYRLAVYPDKSRQCVVMKTAQAKMLPSPLELLQGDRVKRIPLGTEVVDGHSCKVEHVTLTSADGKTVDAKIWEAEDLQGVPVKIETEIDHKKLTALYRDIAIGTLNQELFTPPDRCTPYDKMGQVVESKTIR